MTQVLTYVFVMNLYRPGSIIAEMEAVLLNHPDAECILYNTIHRSRFFAKFTMKEKSCKMIRLKHPVDTDYAITNFYKRIFFFFVIF